MVLISPPLIYFPLISFTNYKKHNKNDKQLMMKKKGAIQACEGQSVSIMH